MSLVCQHLLFIGTSRSYSDKPYSVWLVQASGQPDAKTSTWKHTTLTQETDIQFTGGNRTRNPSKRAVFERTATGIGSLYVFVYMYIYICMYVCMCVCMYVCIRSEVSTASLLSHKHNTNSHNILSFTEWGITQQNKYLMHDTSLRLIFLKTATDV